MYQECIKCPKIGISCDGPNFFAMSAPELLIWCKERKAELHLSNAAIAEKSCLPKGTVDRLFAGEHMDFRYETIRQLVKGIVLLGCKEWSGDPCPDPTDSEKAEMRETIRRLEKDIAHLEDRNKDLEKNNASLETLVKNTNDRYTKDKDFLRKQLDDRYYFLKRKDKVIVILSVLLGLSVLTIITALVIDKLDPTKGYFWLRSFLGGDGNHWWPFKG